MRRRWTTQLLALGALGCLTVVGCSAANRSPALPQQPTPSNSAWAALGAEVGEVGEVPAEAEQVTIAFAGDVHFQDQVRTHLGSPRTALDPIAEELSAADITVVNLETAITTRGTPEPKNYTFRAPGSALDALEQGGIDVVSMANNHSVDYGSVGLADTLVAARESSIQVVGIGENLQDALQPASFDVQGTTVAILGATQFYDRTATTWAADLDKPGVASALEPEALLAAVKAADQENDVVVVYLHWGLEGMDCPTSGQVELSDELSAAGADIIVGSHTHRILGSGWKNGSFVSYGLGNFIWYSRNSVRATASGVLTVTIQNGEPVQQSLAPATIPYEGIPKPLSGTAKRAAKTSFKELRGCTDLTAQPHQ